MINSIQKNYAIPSYGKQQVGFGAVNLKGYSLEELEKAFQADLVGILSESEINTAAKSMAKRLHEGLQPVIEKFQRSAETLTLFITKPDREKLNWIGAGLRGAQGQPTGVADMDLLLKAEFDFLNRVKKY